MILQKIISGGQIGADRAGLDAALKMGLDTGGWMPRGFTAKDGFHPEFAQIYKIKEHTSQLYPPRTAMNVKESDGTVRFALNFNSPGEVLTLKCVNSYKKPYYDVPIMSTSTAPFGLAKWIADNNIVVLNVAGNAQTNIEEFVVAFLCETITLLRSWSSNTP